jgi:plastocyanin
MRWPSRGAGRRAAALAALVLTVVAGGCGSDSDPDPGAAGGGDVLTIENFAFSPEPLTVPVGTVVRVVNKDDAPHTATADDMSFDTGELARDESKEITLSAAGELTYHCDIHDYMRGVIRVGG